MSSTPQAYATVSDSGVKSVLSYLDSVQEKIEKLLAEHERQKKINSTLKQTHNPLKPIKGKQLPEGMSLKQRDEIIQLYESGMTQKQIVKKVGWCQSSISRVISLAEEEGKGFNPNRVNPAKEKRIVELWKAGKRINQIATEMGLAFGSVRYWIVKNGFDPAKNKPQSTKSKIEKKSGQSASAIADKLKTSPKYVKRVLGEKQLKGGK